MDYASRNRVPLLATGDGHGYISTIETVQNGIQLDLGKFKDVSINTAANLLTVGGAVKFANVIEALQGAGKEISKCSDLGI